MSTAEISYTQSKTLNLLLKQQVVTEIKNTQKLKQADIINFHQNVKLDEQETLNKFSAKITYNDNFYDKCDDIKIQLGNIQVEESSSIEHHKTLCESYDLLENLLDHILQHVECVILEIKTSNKLALVLNEFVSQEMQLESLKLGNTSVDLSEIEILQEIKNKLYVTLNKYEKITEIRQEYERRKRDYHLALKNFKIILEVMDMNEKCLEKLMQQFHDVVIGCRDCRSVLEREIPYIMTERMKILGECMNRFGEYNEKLLSNRTAFMGILSSLGTQLNSVQFTSLKDSI